MSDVCNYLIQRNEVFVLIFCLSRPRCLSRPQHGGGIAQSRPPTRHPRTAVRFVEYFNNSRENNVLFFFSVFCQTDTSGPVFIQEPPNYVDFSNTTGTKIICQARGVPLPNITWTKSNGEPIGTVPGLRQVCSEDMILSRNS